MYGQDVIIVLRRPIVPVLSRDVVFSDGRTVPSGSLSNALSYPRLVDDGTEHRVYSDMAFSYLSYEKRNGWTFSFRDGSLSFSFRCRSGSGSIRLFLIYVVLLKPG